MNTDRLEFLSEVVMPHVQAMTTLEKWNRDIAGCAVMDFNSYIDNTHATGKPVSKQYDCGMRGCLAGWYRMMAREDERIGPYDLDGFALSELAEHFGIEHTQAVCLFAGLGGGYENDGIENEEHSYDTTEALEARARYLEELLAA